MVHFISVIYLELIFVKGIMSESRCYFSCGYPVATASLTEKMIPFSPQLLFSFVKYPLTILCGTISRLSTLFILLVYLSVISPISNCVNHYSFILSFEVR